MMYLVYIGIGSNLGDRAGNLLTALEYLEEKGLTVDAVSSIYETEPQGLSDQPWFLNMAVRVTTALCPRDLLALLQNIEAEMGRVRDLRWGPRIIDLDILLYEELDESSWEKPGKGKSDLAAEGLKSSSETLVKRSGDGSVSGGSGEVPGEGISVKGAGCVGVIREPDLEIPHPRLKERAFVLIPLLEIDKDISIPDGTPLKNFLPEVSGNQEVRLFRMQS